MSSIKEEDLINKLEKLTKEYIDFNKNIDDEVYTYINKYYINVTKSIFKLFNYYSISKSALNHSDKELYSNAKRIISNYEALMKTYNDMEHYYADSYAIQLVNEIINVIKNQYETFKEQTKFKQNPVTIEKTSIIDGYALNIATQVNEIQNNFMKTYVTKTIYNVKNSEQKNYVEQFNIINNIKINSSMHQLFFNVSSYLTNCVDELDSLQNRKIANKYFVFLKYQQEIMSNIIKQQITKLDKEIGKKKYDESIKILVSLIINQVIETYDLLENYVQNIDRLYRISEIAQKPEMDFDTFNKNFNKYLEKEKSISLDVFILEQYLNYTKKLKKDIFNTIKEIMLERKKPYNQNSAYSKIKKDYEAVIAITDEFLNKLSKLNIYSKSNEQILKNSEYFEIIDGVDQTMTIKSKVLLENKNILQVDINNNIEELNFDTQNLKLKITDELLNAYFISLKKDDIQNHIKKYLQDLIKCKQCEFEVLNTEININELENMISKKLYDFKKETLFYEISTFDEILYYSIEKIRETDSINVKKYIMFIDDTKESIMELLKNNNIEIINPKPFDKFNSKEHKVLIAEQNPLFKKGEIIKVNTVGYKQFETIILKANVIAAR